MNSDRPDKPRKRIAIAIQLIYPLPWHHDCYQGIIEYGGRQGWNCVVDPHLVGSGPDFDPSVYDGVVGRLEDSTARIVTELGIPAVNHRNCYKPEDQANVKDLPSVCNDSYSSGQIAAEHLIATGYRRFGFIGFENHIDTSIKGMHQVVQAQGFGPIDTLSLNGHYDTTRENSIAMRRKLDAWLIQQARPVGILVLQYAEARYVAHACNELGLRVPQDVGIVSAQSDTMVVANTSPSLSSIEFDYYQQGYEAAALLHKLMNGERADPLHRNLAPKRLVVRDSTDVFLSDDPMITQAMRHIAENIRQNPTVEDIAEALNTSRRTLHRHFDEALGRPVNEEIARLRLSYIQRLLIETDLPIVRIASDCGFSSQSYLTHFFRREAGTTPSDYRKQYKSQGEPSRKPS